MAGAKKQGDNKQKAREKARELIQDAGKKLSAQEAKKIESKTNIPIQQVLKIAERQDVRVTPKVQDKVEAIVQQRSGSTTVVRNESNSGPGGQSSIDGGNGDGQARGNNGSNKDSSGGAGLGNGNSGSVENKQQQFTPIDGATKQPEPGPSFDASAFEGLINNYSSQLDSYRSRFNDVANELQDALKAKTDAEGRATGFQSQLDALKLERDAVTKASEEAKRQGEEKEQRRLKEEQLAKQLGTLRGGYKSGAFGGSGSSGARTGDRALATGQSRIRAGGLLQKAYDEIDPTASVLDAANSRKESVSGAPSSQNRRARALERGLAARSVSSYYARRFG